MERSDDNKTALIHENCSSIPIHTIHTIVPRIALYCAVASGRVSGLINPDWDTLQTNRTSTSFKTDNFDLFVLDL
jgi:hypothetical protein